MDGIGRLTFVALDGDPPVGFELDVLPKPSAVLESVRLAFKPFFDHTADVEILNALGRPTELQAGIHLIYVYGHCWLVSDEPFVASRADDVNISEKASELLQRLLDNAAAERTVLILDCCHAAAFDRVLGQPLAVPRLTVYAAAADEEAIALHGDKASRLSLAFQNQLSGTSPYKDLAHVASEIANELDRDGLISGQHVSYRMNGHEVRIRRATNCSPGKRKRERTVTLIRNILLGIGAAAGVSVIWLCWFYWNHALIDVSAAGLGTAAPGIRLVGYEEAPDTNGSSQFVNRIVQGDHVRLWVPTTDLILRLDGRFKDGAERGLSVHLNLKPTLDPHAKFLTLALPPIADIMAHPDMAFVPVTHWFHGRDSEPRVNRKAYWIDLRPPTVAQYLPIAEALLAAGRLQVENSFLLTAEQRSAAVNQTNLEQLRTLNKDLGAVFGVIDQANSSHVSAASDIVVGLRDMPCQACPAPMTKYEAEQYCASTKKRLPTDLEWELAVRGVDGRVYPWGNQFDPKRANVPGLPAKGDPPPSLKPVDAYPNERSPFGLLDTVGNAGDWVENESGSYDRVYMGATYRYNPEDATAFRMLPVTDEDYLVQEITARCAVDASPVVTIKPQSSVGSLN